MQVLEKALWSKLEEAARLNQAGLVILNSIHSEVLIKSLRYYEYRGLQAEVPDTYVTILKKIVDWPHDRSSGSETTQHNRYPYKDTGGVSHYQKKGWAINRPKRK